MPVILNIPVENVDQLRNAGMYDTGALIHIQSSSSESGTFADLSGTGSTPTIPLVAGTAAYVGYDPNGTNTTWYRTQFENAGASRVSGWSEPFLVGGSVPSAVGQYAQIARVKLRKGITDITQDPLLQFLCDQANSWLETKIGRVIAPWPAFATTVASGFGTGTNTGVLTATAGLALGDAIMFGAVSGTHEHGIVSAISGTTVTLQANLSNSYAAAQPVKRVYVFDGDGYDYGRTLKISAGIVSVLSLEVAVVTNGPFTQIAGTDFFIRPVQAKRSSPAAPGFRIEMTDYPGGGSSVAPLIYIGKGNIRIDGQLGWAAIPDDLTGLGEKLVVAAFQTRGSSGGNQIAIGTDGTRVFEQAMSVQDWQLIKLYSNEIPGI
jgi:hypothetical protein